jgi:hypothetical protein
MAGFSALQKFSGRASLEHHLSSLTASFSQNVFFDEFYCFFSKIFPKSTFLSAPQGQPLSGVNPALMTNKFGILVV